MYWVFQSLHIFPNTCYYFSFLLWPFDSVYKMVSHCGFDLHFPNGYDTEHLFICLLAICISSLEKCLLRSFAYFLNRLSFLLYSCKSSSYIIKTSPLDIWFINIFSHSELSFHFPNGVHQNTKVLNFDEVQYIYFFPLVSAFVVITKKALEGLPWWSSG